MKKVIIIFFLVVPFVFSQSNIESGYSFLKNGFSARNISLGDFGVVGVNDLSALYYNPSYLASIKNSQLMFSHNSLFNDLTSENIGASFKIFNIPFAIGINTTKVSDIEVRNKPGEAIAKISANYFYASLSSAIEYEKIYFGTSLKYIYENIYYDESSAYAFDFGFSYKNFYDRFTIGAIIKNIGNATILNSINSKLPSEFQVGISYDYKFSSFELVALTGYQNYLNENKSHLHFGSEVKYDNIVAARIGFLTGYESKNFTSGIGITLKNFNIDYAYIPIKYGLGDNHIITIIYNY